MSSGTALRTKIYGRERYQEENGRGTPLILGKGTV